MLRTVKNVLAFILSLPVLFYRGAISPFLSPSCRHVPTCSQYMLDALKIHGPFTGLLLGTGRILRCRPGGTHGYDPVPLFRFRRIGPYCDIFHRREADNRLKVSLKQQISTAKTAATARPQTAAAKAAGPQDHQKFNSSLSCLYPALLTGSLSPACRIAIWLSFP